ncbi:MAG: GxxExxY protein [Parafilimonas sp.]
MKYSEITEKIIGCAMKVHKELGFGFQEYIYHRALEIELKRSNQKFISEYEMPIYYSGEKIGLRRVDFFIEDKIMVEIKAVTILEDQHLAQALNYLEASASEIGLLLNFGSLSLQFKRLHNKKYKPTFPQNP